METAVEHFQNFIFPFFQKTKDKHSYCKWANVFSNHGKSLWKVKITRFWKSYVQKFCVRLWLFRIKLTKSLRMSSQRETCNKIGSGFTLGAPEKRQQRCFQCSQWEPQTAAHNLSVQLWQLRHNTFAQKRQMEKEKYLFSFFQFYKFFMIKSAYISKSWFLQKTRSFVYNFCTTCMDRNHISKFLFLT